MACESVYNYYLDMETNAAADLPNKMEPPATVEAAYALACNGEPAPRSHRCDDYNSGQCACETCEPGRWRILREASAARNAATAEHRAWIASITGAVKALGDIGRAIAAALSPGNGLYVMACDAAAIWEIGSLPYDVAIRGNFKGAKFTITATRGNAKAHAGKVGVCKFVGESSFGGYQSQRYGRIGGRTSMHLALSVPGVEKLVYVSPASVERVRFTADEIAERVESTIVANALKPMRPKYVGTLPTKARGRGKARVAAKLGSACYVVEGYDAGKFGTLFWTGPDKRTGEADARVGIKTASGDVVWASAYQCAHEPMTTVSDAERKLVERVAADAALEGDHDKAREVLKLTRTAKIA